MKPTVAALITILAFASAAQSQSTLSFPRAIQHSELSTSGYAIVNPGATDAAVTLTLYRNTGTVEATANVTIRARGQVAKLASEFFPAATNAGWVEATSTAAGLQGFWFGGDFTTFADGAEAAASSNDLFLGLVAAQSELHLANTGTETVVAQIKIYGADGFELAISAVRNIPPKGFLRSQISSLFPGLDLNTATHIRLTCINPFAATVIVRNLIAGPSWAVLNAIPATSTQAALYFPHIVDGPLGIGNYRSAFGVTNLTANSNEISVTFTKDDGTDARTIQRIIPPNGSIRELARNLFGLTDAFASGWLRVTATGPITGFAAYADTVAGSAAVVPPQSEPQGSLLFAHIADLDPWWTGLALLNTNTRSANVEIFALAPDGSLIGGAENVATAKFSIASGNKVSKLLSEWIPQTQNRASDGGFVFVRSDVPLFGIELFFRRDLKILANVAAGRLASGITYVPPAPR